MAETTVLHPTKHEIDLFLEKFVTDEKLKVGATAILNSWYMANQLGLTGLLLDESRERIELLLKQEAKKK